MDLIQTYVNVLPYWPSTAWFAYHLRRDVVKIAQTTYDKKLKLNSCHIAAANGVIQLSIPLQGSRNQHALINEVKISEVEPWRRVHLQSIKSAYGKAPFFEELWPQIEALYAREDIFLYEFNAVLLAWVYKILKLPLLVEEQVNTYALKESVQPCRPYQQVFIDRYPFVHNLCILDLLMNCGPLAYKYLSI